MLAYRLVRAQPDGAWDAWAIWNLRARFLASSADWPTAFDSPLAWSHTDYPLLLSSAIARVWAMGGSDSAAVPVVIGVAFMLGVIVAVAGSLQQRHGPLAASLGLALLIVPEFVRQGSSQLADVPLALFTVLAVVLVARPQPGAVRLGLAGAALGCAAWTKNEGLVVAAGFPLIYLVLLGAAAGRRAAAQSAADMTIGLLPVLVVVLLFKALVAPPGDLVDGWTRPGAINYWSDSARVMLVLRMMASGALQWGGWWPAFGPVIGVIAVAALPDAQGRRGDVAVTAAGALLLLQLATFFVVYVMTPHSVAWHVSTSWPRLIVQMWPTLVWWACTRFGSTAGATSNLEAA